MISPDRVEATPTHRGRPDRSRFRAHQVLTTGCALLICSVLSWPVSSQTAPDGLRACAADTDDARRLACYDREVRQMLATPPAPAPAPASPADTFGLQSKKAEEHVQPAALRELTAHVTGVTERPRGGMLIQLDNDQVWQQTDTAPGFYVNTGDPVKITPGAFGSFWMTAQSRPSARVKRIR